MNKLSQLAKFGACDISDALLKIEPSLKHAGLLPDITMYSPTRGTCDTRISGEAFTVKFVEKEDKTSPKYKGQYIDSLPKDSILFLSTPASVTCAAFGGIMGARAQQQGVKGAIIDGRLRDLAEHRAIQFPVFSKGTSTVGVGGGMRVSETGVPVKLSAFNDITIEAGDYLVADLDGVVCCPKRLIDQVLELMPKLTEADDKVMEDVKRGRTVADSFKEHRG